MEYQSVLLGDIIDQLGSKYDCEQNDIKSGVLSLVSGGCFIREPEDIKLSEQKLSFIPQSSEQAIIMLKSAMYHKLDELLGRVEEDIFSKIIS